MNQSLAPRQAAQPPLPVRALRAIGRAFGGVTERVKGPLTLVPYYLQRLLWLISTGFQDLAQQGYGQNSAVYACLTLLASAVSEPHMKAYTNATGSTVSPTPIDGAHPLMQLIAQPNELMTEYAMWELVTLQLGIVGRSHWYKERDNLGRIIALWPLRPDRVGPVYLHGPNDAPSGDREEMPPLSERGRPRQVIDGWSYQVPGQSRYLMLDRDDVVTYLRPDPAGDSGGMAEGLGPLMVLASEVAVDNEATSYVGTLLQNHAVPGTVLQTQKTLSDEEEARLIKAAFVSEYGGAQRGVPAVIDGGTTLTEIGFNLQQLEFPALRRIAESRIAAAFGVPAILVGLYVGLESGVRATIREQKEHFTNTTLKSYWRRYADVFTAEVAAEFDRSVIMLFDLSDVEALADQRTRDAQPIVEGFKAGGVSLNEYRDKVLRLPPLPGKDGEVYYIPMGVTIVGQDMTPLAALVQTLPVATAAANAGKEQAGGAGPGKPSGGSAPVSRDVTHAASAPAPATAGSNGHGKSAESARVGGDEEHA